MIGDVSPEAICAADGEVAGNSPNDELPGRFRETLDGADYLFLLDEGDDPVGSGTVEELTDVSDVEVVVICHELEDSLTRAEADVRQYLYGGRGARTRPGRRACGHPQGPNSCRAHVRVITREQLETIADDVPVYDDE